MLIEFKKFREYLSRIPNIDRGGCAIAALAMYRYAKRLGLEAHIEYLYTIEQNYNQNCAAIEGAGIGTCCGHAICVVDGNPYDSTGYVVAKEWNYRHVVPEHIVIQGLRIVNIWNDSFDRTKWLPQIQSELDEILF